MLVMLTLQNSKLVLVKMKWQSILLLKILLLLLLTRQQVF